MKAVIVLIIILMILLSPVVMYGISRVGYAVWAAMKAPGDKQ